MKSKSLLIFGFGIAVLVCAACTPAAVGLMPPPSPPIVSNYPISTKQEAPQGSDITTTDPLTQTLTVEELPVAETIEPTATTTATATLEPPATPTPVVQAAAFEPNYTPTSLPPAVELTPTVTTQEADCSNRLELIEDVTMIDGLVMPAGESFLKVWRVQNSGSCTWTTGYALVFSSGEQMGASDEVFLTREVPAGDSVDLLVEMTTPTAPGSYEANWLLRSSDGLLFGAGESRLSPLRIRLFVESENPVFYGFARDFCAASWSSQMAAELECPSSGLPGDAGWVGIDLLPILEDGRMENEPALILAPSLGDGGYISGFYPALRIEAGDRFKAVIGCLQGFSGCSVVFQLNYYTLTNSAVRSLGSWKETYDETITHLDINLGGLAGQDVIFQLLVLSDGESNDDRAFWLCPRVER